MEFSRSGRLAILFGISILLVMATRLPLTPPHLFSFDTVNFALALQDFDPIRNQPQPPGYPLFVAEARLVHRLFGSPEQTFAFLGSLISSLAVAMLYLLGRRMFSPWVGLIAAALLFVNPPFFYAGLTSPLRPHLALLSTLVAYFCWRTMQGERWCLYAAALALGLGSGIRPELSLLLFPLWAWAAWKSRDVPLVVRSTLLFGASLALWVVVLAIVSGGLARLIPYFFQYLFAQTQSTSVILDPATSWRRAAGRAFIWTGLGALPWIWALPLGWRMRRHEEGWKERLAFLAVWFVPAFLLNLFVHIGDPDQALTSIPALCLLGGACLASAEQWLSRVWSPTLQEGGQGLVVWLVLFANVFLFFAEFSLPKGREPLREFHGLQSLTDAVRIGVHESSYARVRWVEQMTDLSLGNIEVLKSSTKRPVVVIWTKDGEPVWRKVCYYLPSVKVYALDDRGDPGVVTPLARLWSGNKPLANYSGSEPIRLPVPKEARLIWTIPAGSYARLSKEVPLQAAPPLYYTDLPPDAPSIRWGSFELVAEPGEAATAGFVTPLATPPK